MVVSDNDNGYTTKVLMEKLKWNYVFLWEYPKTVAYTNKRKGNNNKNLFFTISFDNTSDYNEKRKRFWGGFGYETNKIVKYP